MRTMILSRKSAMLCALSVFFLLTGSVRAGKEKEKERTPSPTFSAEPTPAPTMAPTTLAPSDTPSLAPTPGPSVSSSPTVTASEAPTGSVRAVIMPKMTLVLQKTSRASVDFFLGDSLESFFATELLSTGKAGKHRKAFESVSLESVVEQDSETATVSLEGTALYAINENDGNGNRVAVPSEEDLSKMITTYFSFFGIEDLQEYLLSTDLPISEVTSVSVNGELIVDRPVAASTKGDTGDSSSSSNSDNLNGFIIAGIVVGCLLVFAAVALFVWRGHRRANKHQPHHDQREIVVIESLEEGGLGNGNGNNKKDNDNDSTSNSGKSNTESASKDDTGNSSDGIEDAVPPPPPAETNSDSENEAHVVSYPTQQQQQVQQLNSIRITNPFDTALGDEDGGDDYTSDGDIISVAESLHFEDNKKQGPLFNVSSSAANGPPRNVALTGKSSVRPPAPPPPPQQQQQSFQYDASRLDHVISSARGTMVSNNNNTDQGGK